jgi:hypothetical protein
MEADDLVVLFDSPSDCVDGDPECCDPRGRMSVKQGGADEADLFWEWSAGSSGFGCGFADRILGDSDEAFGK